MGISRRRYTSGKPITPVLGQYAVELINEEFRPFFVFGNINSATTPDFFRIDFSGSYKTHLNKNMVLEFDLSIQNIFNRKNIKFQSNTFLETDNQEEFIILQREINYLGRTPSLFITLYL